MAFPPARFVLASVLVSLAATSGVAEFSLFSSSFCSSFLALPLPFGLAAADSVDSLSLVSTGASSVFAAAAAGFLPRVFFASTVSLASSLSGVDFAFVLGVLVSSDSDSDDFFATSSTISAAFLPLAAFAAGAFAFPLDLVSSSCETSFCSFATSFSSFSSFLDLAFLPLPVAAFLLD